MKRHDHLMCVSVLVGFGLVGVGCGGEVSRDGQVGRATVQFLGSYNVRLDQTSISGVSSGAMMATQFGVAYSSIIAGVGMIAGGPYHCAEDDTNTALSTCMIGSPSVSDLVSQTNAFASSGLIDATSNLAKQKLWIFHGYNDGMVKKSVSDAAYSYYQTFIDEGNLYYSDDNTNAAHAMITSSYGQACNITGGHFINNCGYDAAGKLLQHIYGTLSAPNTGTLSGSIINFDATPFYSGSLSDISMDSSGYVYVPASCAAQQACRVHIALHGCVSNAQTLGSEFYTNAGYNQWADTNNIIVLYPQTISTLSNPNGCWDWWGYTNSDYADQSGPQMAVLRAMLTQLSGGYSGWNAAPSGSFAAPTGLAIRDRSSNHVALSWTGVGGSVGYNVYRAPCSGCGYSKINTAVVNGPSYSDHGRSPSSSYYYYVTAVNGSNVESGASATVGVTTPGSPPFCDPYYRTVYQHWSEGRSYTLWWDAYDTWAYGSDQWVGYTGPTSLTTYVLLTESGPSSGYFTVGTPCN